jgi:hypothetical protein
LTRSHGETRLVHSRGIRYHTGVYHHPQQTRPIGAQGYGRAEAGRVGKDPSDDRWHVQVAAGDVRVVTLDKLDDLYRFDVIDENAFVWKPGMARWSRLASLAGIEQPQEPYHVQFGPSDVRVLTIEQLDDFYRLGVIEESTFLWQKGMPRWRTLKSIAGIEDELRSEPATLPRRDEPARLPAKIPSSHSGAPVVRQQNRAFVPSTQPLAFDVQLPAAYPSRGPRWPLWLAFAAGSLLAAIRNDLVYSALRKTPFANRYMQAETSLLGGPASGTTRSVVRLVADCGGHLEPVRLPWAVTQFVDSQKASVVRSGADVAAQVTQTASSAALNPPSVAGPAKIALKAEEGRPASESGAPSSNGAKGPSAKANSASSKVSRLPAVNRAAKPRSSGGQSGLQPNGSYFDPLNASL